MKYKLRANLKDLTISLKGEQIITFALQRGQDARDLFDNLNDKELEVIVDKFFPKRSLQANRYCWKLIGEIAYITGKSTYDVYLDMLCDYGQSDIIEVSNKVDVSKYFKHYRELEKCDNKTTYIVIEGSSQYNSAEMHRLIDGIVQEAKNLGIQTETPEEIAKMVSLWKSNKEN